MNRINLMRPWISAAMMAGFGLLVLTSTIGCDSGDDGPTAGDVAGEYRFTELRFVPLSSAVSAVNVLDTLVVSETRLQLFSSGRFTLLYQFQGGNAEFIGGNFSVSDDRITLKGESDQERFYRALLLGLETRLDRNQIDTSLSGDIRKKANLEEFSDRYVGLPSVDGNLKIALTRV